MRIAAIVWLALAVWPASAGAAEVPAWLKQAASTPISPAAAEASAVILLDEVDAVVRADGTLTTRRLYAARLLGRDARDAGTVSEVYLTDTGKVRRMRGWLIRPSGDVAELGDAQVVDAALSPNDVYNEARIRILAAGDTEPGTVFGVEVQAEDRAIFAQIEWTMQGRWPVRSARRALTVPPGWSVTAAVFNHPPVEPSVSGQTYSWVLTDLPLIADEASGPALTDLAPRLAVGYTPPFGAAGHLARFTSWAGVSTWLAALSDPQAVPDAILTEKARQLTAEAETPAARIAVLAKWVQQVPYISIQTGIGRGGGYRPRRATDVLAKNHGDCKDKATLLRALLAAVGIPSYPVAVFSGDRRYVREAWPSPQQFNHVILGIHVEDTTAYPDSTRPHPAVGPLLFFDPTDPYTPPGSLPGHEEGGLALVVLPAGGGLVRLPGQGAVSHLRNRLTEGTVQADGTFAGTVATQTTGDLAARERASFARLGAGGYAGAVTARLGTVMPGARVVDVSTQDGPGGFTTKARAAVPGHAQMLPHDLLMVTPPFRTLEGVPALTSGARTLPVDLDGIAAAETLRLHVRPPLAVEELPAPATLDTPYGRYRLTARSEGDTVIVERRFVLHRGRVPAADYGQLRGFLDTIRSADTSPLVLRRAPQ